MMPMDAADKYTEEQLAAIEERIRAVYAAETTMRYGRHWRRHTRRG